MQWAGEPKLEEVLSDPIVRAVMAFDRVDPRGAAPIPSGRDQAVSLAGRLMRLNQRNFVVKH
jgi:hypothetical protein